MARTIFMHTLAFNEPLKGLSPEQLRYSMLGPASEVGFIEEARKKFVQESAYLDDRPGAPMRFLAEANLTQIIRREEKTSTRARRCATSSGAKAPRLVGSRVNDRPAEELPEDGLTATGGTHRHRAPSRGCRPAVGGCNRRHGA